MGVQSVRVDIGYDAYAESDTAVISAIDGLVASIKGSQKLVIADASREYYRKNPEPWAQFQTDWIARVTDLAGRYQPYAYLVIKEPGWYAAMISDAKTNPLVQEPSSWVSLLSELNAAVKSVSPGTLTGISTTGTSVGSGAQAALYTQIMAGAAAMDSNDILGFDIYGEGDFNGAAGWLGSNSTGGKQVWVAETWSNTTGAAATGQEQTDAEWVEVAYDFCAMTGASLMNPFFTDSMCSYNISGQTTPATIIQDYETLILESYAVYRELIGGQIPVVS